MGAGQGVIGQAASQDTSQGTVQGTPQPIQGAPQYGLGATGYTPPASAGPRPPSLTSMLFGGQDSYRRASAPRYGNQGQFSGADVTNLVKNNMGNYDVMTSQLQQAGVTPAQVAQASGQNMGNLYTYMNRPDYKQYGPNGQFYQPIYQPQYTNYRNPSVGSGGFGGVMGNLGSYGMMGGAGNQGYGQGGIFGGGFQAPSMYTAQGGYPMPQVSPQQSNYAMYAEGGEVATDDGIAALLAK